MRFPAGSTIATATFQLFFAASASAGAAAFLACSRLMGEPDGLGICATALASEQSANVTTIMDLTANLCDMLVPTRIIGTFTPIAAPPTLHQTETSAQSFSARD